MEDPRRWIVGLVAVAAIVGLILLARGEEGVDRRADVLPPIVEVAA